MTDREQAEITGKTVLELGAQNRRLAALEALAQNFAASMRGTAQLLHPVRTVYTSATLPQADPLDQYPDRSEVVALLNDLQTTRDRIAELRGLLQRMGADLQ
jgi:hypothetical protein